MTAYQDTPGLAVFQKPFPLDELATPCLLLDTDKMEANIRRFREHWAGTNVTIRPHLKTCRSWPLALSVMSSSEGPACVATMGEAEAIAAYGARDIVLAVGIRPSLFARAQALMQKGCSLKILLDSMTMAKALTEWAKEHDAVFSVLLEVDCDGHRAGLAPDSQELAAIAGLLKAGGQDVAGILTHAGSAYDISSVEKIKELALREAKAASDAASLLKKHGHACKIVSIGSTPTGMLGDAKKAADLGITEIRAGVFVFMDLVMEGLGVCTRDDIALTVLTGMIGGFPGNGIVPDRILTDAGWAALSSDRGLASRFEKQGYGLVCDIEGSLLPGLVAGDLNQEHAMLRLEKEAAEITLATLKNASATTRLRIIPNHACAAAMMHKEYYLVRNGLAYAKAYRYGGW